MKKYILALGMVAVLLLSMANVNAATEQEINESINKGLVWLAGQQEPDGSWRYNSNWSSLYTDVATTALVVLKFEDRAKEMGLDPFNSTEYEYANNVTAGLNYIFSHVVNDTNGVHFSMSDTYSTGTAMMAVAASDAPNRVITTGPLAGETYQTALQGMMDWMDYSQQRNINFSCDEGGWDYGADPMDNRDWADQSNTGYATLGIGFASAPSPSGLGLTIPAAVLTRLDTYINNVQDPMNGDNWDGGSWYLPCGQWNMTNILKTGNLIHEMALVGDDVSDTRVQNAISYIENHWNDTGQQPEFLPTSLGWKDSYQAMFTMMKGFEAFGIETITVGGSDIDWFNEVADVIIANQNTNGSWKRINVNISEGEESANLRAAWALLTLERVVPAVTKTVYVDIKPSSCPNPINTKSNGVLPVAVLGTEDFDVTTIDPSSIQIKLDPGVEGVSPLRWNYEDVATPFDGELCDCHDLNGDGFMDLTLKFDTQDVVAMNLLTLGGETIPLTITGNLKEEYGGTAIEGQDCVRVLEKKGKKK